MFLFFSQLISCRAVCLLLAVSEFPTTTVHAMMSFFLVVVSVEAVKAHKISDRWLISFNIWKRLVGGWYCSFNVFMRRSMKVMLVIMVSHSSPECGTLCESHGACCP